MTPDQFELLVRRLIAVGTSKDLQLNLEVHSTCRISKLPWTWLVCSFVFALKSEKQQVSDSL
jgi:hypothetical protein